MELNFDSRGNLKPYEIIKISFEDFQEVFVNSFDKDSRRHLLLEKYLNYLQDFSQILNGNFYQWIDGSFVTTKYNPRDIDLVSIIHFEDFEMNSKKISDKFVSLNARKLYVVDAYVVADYPESHPKYSFTHTDLLYWKDLFSQTKVNRAKRQYPKGFVQINFLKDE